MPLPKYDWNSGSVFGKLLLTGKSFIEKKQRQVEAICDCGIIKWIRWQSLQRGRTKSCGCIALSTTHEKCIKHGMTHTPLYSIWRGMKQRCYNENDKGYPDYGGRGVIVCEEWVRNFQAFYDWAMANGYKPGLMLDKDKLSNTQVGDIYCPEFCCFLTPKESSQHRGTSVMITYRGVVKTISAWCEELYLNKNTISGRIRKGWDAEKAFETPIDQKFNRFKNK